MTGFFISDPPPRVETNSTAQVVRSADCDMYNVLFHPRVQEILETVARRSDCTASYINLRLPVKPFDELIAYQSLANFELPHSD